MKVELRWLNGFWLMLPLLAWNIILVPAPFVATLQLFANTALMSLMLLNLPAARLISFVNQPITLDFIIPGNIK